MSEPARVPPDSEFLAVRDLRRYFPVRRGMFLRTIGHVQAVDGVSFTIGRGQTLGLVGESGCGKTTTARLVVQLEQPDAGQVLLDGTDTAGLTGAALRRFRTATQMISRTPTLRSTRTTRRAASWGNRCWCTACARGRNSGSGSLPSSTG